MNDSRAPSNASEVVWPVVGIVIAICAGMVLPRMEISFGTGLVICGFDLVFAVVISGSRMGARVAALFAGVCMGIPGHNWELALFRFALMCLMAVPLIIATGLVIVAPIAGIKARLAFVCSWFGTHELRAQPRRMDWKLFSTLVVATVILGAGIFAVKAAGTSNAGLLLRWFTGGIAVMAFAEILSAAFPMVGGIAGVTVPAFFRSPYRARSLAEFWGVRWNIAASQLFRKLCFAPLERRSAVLGQFAAFAASAVAHGLMALMALGSWQMGLVWGAFFLAQPLFIGIERWMNVRRWPAAAGRAWTLGILAITCPLFVEPMARIMEEAWGGPNQVLGPTMVGLCTVMVLSIVFVAASRFSLPVKISTAREAQLR